MSGAVNDFFLTIGASDASYFLYMHTKGKTENAIIDLQFPQTSIYRPGVLITPDGRNELRVLEWMGQSVLRLLDWYSSFSVPVSVLGKVMVYNAFTSGLHKKGYMASDSHEEEIKPSIHILENKDIVNSLYKMYYKKYVKK